MKSRGLLLLVLGCCALAWAAEPPAPTLTPIVAGEKPQGPRATDFAPLAYFNQNCARCHGEYGSFYSDKLGDDRDEASLREVIAEMANGPGAAPLSPAELDALTAWHRALGAKKPFIVIVQAQKTDAGWQLSGEVSPGASLQINGEAVEVEGSKWTHCIAQGAAKLRAQKGEAVTELEANGAAWAP